MADMTQISADLAAEHDDLDALVAPLTDDAWSRDTPAEGWAVRDQVSHLGYYDRKAVEAVSDPDGFKAYVTDLFSDPRKYLGADVETGRSVSGAELLAWWRDGRRTLLETVAGLDPSTRVPWYGPPMSAASFATARLMETWAHGQDVADALGTERKPTERLRHVCYIGARALPFSYVNRGLEPPEAPVRVELIAPDGSMWGFGPDDATDRVTGSALDFALVVTQRRHRDDTALEADGPVADEWLSLAQAFAGPPGPGRQPSA